MIFVNTKSFAETLYKILKKKDFRPVLIFGDMSVEERDEMVDKFRKLEVNVVITTNLMARGIDVPEV